VFFLLLFGFDLYLKSGFLPNCHFLLDPILKSLLLGCDLLLLVLLRLQLYFPLFLDLLLQVRQLVNIVLNEDLILPTQIVLHVLQPHVMRQRPLRTVPPIATLYRTEEQSLNIAGVSSFAADCLVGETHALSGGGVTLIWL
jgi:hypothetical protein